LAARHDPGLALGSAARPGSPSGQRLPVPQPGRPHGPARSHGPAQSHPPGRSHGPARSQPFPSRRCQPPRHRRERHRQPRPGSLATALRRVRRAYPAGGCPVEEDRLRSTCRAASGADAAAPTAYPAEAPAAACPPGTAGAVRPAAARSPARAPRLAGAAGVVRERPGLHPALEGRSALARRGDRVVPVRRSPQSGSLGQCPAARSPGSRFRCRASRRQIRPAAAGGPRPRATADQDRWPSPAPRPSEDPGPQAECSAGDLDPARSPARRNGDRLRPALGRSQDRSPTVRRQPTVRRPGNPDRPSGAGQLRDHDLQQAAQPRRNRGRPTAARLPRDQNRPPGAPRPGNEDQPLARQRAGNRGRPTAAGLARSRYLLGPARPRRNRGRPPGAPYPGNED
jgi:hypothetical protein